MTVLNLNTIGNIATLINESITFSAGVSGNMVEMVDLARQHVSNFTGDTIGSNSILPKFQPAIMNFAKADAVDVQNAGAGGDDLKLGDLTVNAGNEVMTSVQYRKLGEMNLNALGRTIGFAKSLS